MLAIVSENRLFSQAAGTVVVDRSNIAEFIHVRPADFAEFLAREPTLDVLLIDTDGFLDVADTVAFVEKATRALQSANIIMLGYAAESEAFCQCIESGANGCVLKTETLSDLVAAVETVRNGETHCGPEVADAVLRRIRQLAETKSDAAPAARVELTPRELEILRLVDQGMLNKEIARQLELALSTVKNHLHSIFEKLEVNSRRAAVRQALAAGLLTCEPSLDVA